LDTPIASPSAAGAASKPRRQFSAEFKRHLVDLTLAPGASVAGVALAHQLNANQLFKWRRRLLPQPALPTPPVAPLLPVAVLPAPEPTVRPERAVAPASGGAIEIELAGARVRVTGEVDAAARRTVLTHLRAR
jgi:transposase